jgi:WD40 repeat protein
LYAVAVADPERLRGHAREARTLAGITHPTLTGLLDVVEAGGLLILVTPVPPGRPLADLPRPAPAETVCAVGLTVAGALAHAHDHGLPHGALSPTTIRITADRVVTVTELGVSDLLDRAGRAGPTAPRAATGDLYSLGLVLHWLAGGDLPPPQDRLFPGLAEPVAAVGRRAVDLDPARRHPTAHAFQAALACAAADALGADWPDHAGLTLRPEDLTATDDEPAAPEPGPPATVAVPRRRRPAPRARQRVLTRSRVAATGVPRSRPSRPGPVSADEIGTVDVGRPAALVAAAAARFHRALARATARVSRIGRAGRIATAITVSVGAIAIGLASTGAFSHPGPVARGPGTAGPTAAGPLGPPVVQVAVAEGFPAQKAAFSPDGRFLAFDGALWDVRDPAHPAELHRVTSPGGGFSAVSATAFSPDGRVIAFGDYGGHVLLDDIADPASPVPLGAPLTVTTGVAGQVLAVRAVAFSHDGHLLATAVDGGGIRLWDIRNPRAPRPAGPAFTISGVAPVTDGVPVTSLAFQPFGQVLAAANVAGAAGLWDVSHPATPRTLPVPSALGAQALSFSPDGRLLAAVSVGGEVDIWATEDAGAPLPLRVLTVTDGGAASQVVFSPDGRSLAVPTAGGTVYLWDVTSPRDPRQFATARLVTGLGSDAGGIGAAAYSAAFTPDGQWLATVDSVGHASIWSVTGGAGAGLPAAAVGAWTLVSDENQDGVWRETGDLKVTATDFQLTLDSTDRRGGTVGYRLCAGSVSTVDELTIFTTLSSQEQTNGSGSSVGDFQCPDWFHLAAARPTELDLTDSAGDQLRFTRG